MSSGVKWISKKGKDYYNLDLKEGNDVPSFSADN